MFLKFKNVIWDEKIKIDAKIKLDIAKRTFFNDPIVFFYDIENQTTCVTAFYNVKNKYLKFIFKFKNEFFLFFFMLKI